MVLKRASLAEPSPTNQPTSVHQTSCTMTPHPMTLKATRAYNKINNAIDTDHKHGFPAKPLVENAPPAHRSLSLHLTPTSPTGGAYSQLSLSLLTTVSNSYSRSSSYIQTDGEITSLNRLIISTPNWIPSRRRPSRHRRVVPSRP